jgi:hypothetical protein
MYVQKFTPQQRELILNMYHGHCAYCGTKLTLYGNANNRFVIDHIVPQSHKHLYKYNPKEWIWWFNVVPACALCNNRKMQKSLLEYKSWILYQLATYNKFIPGIIKEKPEIKFYFERWISVPEHNLYNREAYIYTGDEQYIKDLDRLKI